MSISSNAVFLQNRSMERLKDSITGDFTYILHPKSLILSSDAGHWNLNYAERTRFEKTETACLKKANIVHLKGEISMSDLTPEVAYEVSFVVKIKNGGYGWEHPVSLLLAVPGEGDKRRLVSLYEKPRGEWLDLKLGNFKATGTGEVSFHLLQEGAHEKKGLLLKGAVVRPMRGL